MSIDFLIEASDVPFQVSNRTGGSQEDGSAAESWEIDVINDRSVSKTRIKCRGDGSRANQKIGKDVLRGGGRQCDIASSLDNDINFMVRLTKAETTKPAKDRLLDHAASTIVSQFQKSNTWPDEQCIDPRFGESELEPMFKKRKMTTLQHQPPPTQTAAVAGPNDIDGMVSCMARNAETTRTERGALKFCKHGREKSRCKDCGGSSICEHGRRKRECKDCGGSSICEHGRRKWECKDCCGSSICEHGRLMSQCKDCGGSSICEHGRRKSRCKVCCRTLAAPE